MDHQSVTPVEIEALIAKIISVTIGWARRHGIWYDSVHRSPIEYFDEEPWLGGALLMLCTGGNVNDILEWDREEARELREELEQLGVYMECDSTCLWGYYPIDDTSPLAQAAYQHARWKWVCRLVEADTADVSGDLYSHFAQNSQDFHRLSPRDFEKLVSSIFAARGWRTEIGPGSNDGGVDLRLWQREPLGEILTLVQIKRYSPSRKINVDAVAALDSHVIRQKADQGLFVTSSSFLPSVNRWAEKYDTQIILADSNDITRWCKHSAQLMNIERNRALASQGLLSLLQEIRLRGTDKRLVVGERFGPRFCLVLRESRTSALLAHLPNTAITGDVFVGAATPVLDGTLQESEIFPAVFRATRSEEKGCVSYWGQRTLFHVWDGLPVRYDTMY